MGRSSSCTYALAPATAVTERSGRVLVERQERRAEVDGVDVDRGQRLEIWFSTW